MTRRRRPPQFCPANSRSLRIFQRQPERVLNFERALVRIWSEEHLAYWRRNAEGGAGSGYTDATDHAGVVTLPEAFALTRHCGPEKEIWFEFVRPRKERARKVSSQRPRRSQAEITIRAERDIEVASYLDGYARLVRATREDGCAGAIATALEGLASTLRAGLIE